MDFSCVSLIILLFGVQVYSQEEGEDESDKNKEKCQEEFYDITGTIESPEYPNNYPDKTNCVYRILTDRMIKIIFNSFSLEESQNCRYDYLQFVFEASKPNSTRDRYCGDGLSKVNGGNLRGKGPLIIGFISDESDNMAGFRFTFELEINGPDPCLSEPCQQGGNCTSYPGYYVCACPDGYAGVNCEIDKDECLSHPCKNNANCIDGINSFTCECINDFEGDLCEIGGDRCASEPCENGGLCVERALDFVCSCPRDFMGDTCETPIPTPAPKETPTTQATTTTTTEAATTATKPDDPQDGEGENEDKGDDEAPTNPTKDDDAEDPENVEQKEPSDPDSNSSVVLTVVIILLLVLVLLAVLAWYWYTRRLKPKDKRVEKPTREVTLINMKTKSERGEGKNGKRQSRTTSINSITMKGKSGGDDQLINQLKKMSEDIIMEEVSDDPHSSSTRLNQHPSPVNRSGTVDKQLTPLNSPSIPVDQPQLKRISIPITQSELNTMTSDSNTLNNPYDTIPKEQRQPYRISPDAAVNLFNQLKQNQGKDFDYRSALERYGPGDFSKKPFPSATFSPFLSPNPQSKQGFPMFQTPLQNNQIFQLPNVPIPNGPAYGKHHMGADNSPEDPRDEEMTELDPEEAAEVVNHFFRSDSDQRKNVSSNEAMDVIQQVRKKRTSERPFYNREQSVIVHPQEVAALINNFNNQPPLHNEDNAKSGSGLPSVYDSSEGGKTQVGWMNRDFRECSPIQEESDGEELRPPANKQKRPSQDFDNPEEVPEEPNSKRFRKKAKRFPYARTLDPEEKVHDWLKNTPKQKANKYKGSPSGSVATETHTLTRPTAKISYKEVDPVVEKFSNEPPSKDMAEENDIPRTIRQPRKSVADQNGGIPVTENKAKSLVEKLVKAPARSNQNIVGPGLGVSRENAFVGEAF